MATLNSIKVAYHQIDYYQNDTFSITVAITDSITGDPVDLTGKELVMQIKKKKTDTTALYELTVGAGTETIKVDTSELATQYDLTQVTPSSSDSSWASITTDTIFSTEDTLVIDKPLKADVTAANETDTQVWTVTVTVADAPTPTGSTKTAFKNGKYYVKNGKYYKR